MLYLSTKIFGFVLLYYLPKSEKVSLKIFICEESFLLWTNLLLNLAFLFDFPCLKEPINYYPFSLNEIFLRLDCTEFFYFILKSIVETFVDNILPFYCSSYTFWSIIFIFWLRFWISSTLSINDIRF